MDDTRYDKTGSPDKGQHSVSQPHVSVARKLGDRGHRARRGERIAYVLVHPRGGATRRQQTNFFLNSKMLSWILCVAGASSVRGFPKDASLSAFDPIRLLRRVAPALSKNAQTGRRLAVPPPPPGSVIDPAFYGYVRGMHVKQLDKAKRGRKRPGWPDKTMPTPRHDEIHGSPVTAAGTAADTRSLAPPQPSVVVGTDNRQAHRNSEKSNGKLGGHSDDLDPSPELEDKHTGDGDTGTLSSRDPYGPFDDDQSTQSPLPHATLTVHEMAMAVKCILGLLMFGLIVYWMSFEGRSYIVEPFDPSSSSAHGDRVAIIVRSGAVGSASRDLVESDDSDGKHDRSDSDIKDGGKLATSGLAPTSTSAFVSGETAACSSLERKVAPRPARKVVRFAPGV